MSALPDWLEPTKQATGLPDWLSAAPKREPASPLTPRGATEAGRALLLTQFEMVFPRVLEMVCEGYTVEKAVKELPIPLDPGAFIRWMNRDVQRYSLLEEAKQFRTEVWAGRIIAHSEGEEEGFINDVARSRLIVDTYWKLMGADHRKKYGDTKTIEMNTTISITAALAQAQGRVIEAQLVEDDGVDLLPSAQYKQLTSGEDEDDE